MIELIKTKLDLCVGCNRCIRECPMEMANVTYQDDAGNIKVKTDHTKCIGCGWCIAVCKHGAREYKDDTGLFFEDLAAGVPISLIAAPSIQTNFSEYKRLFTHLKNIGVKKIFDVSLGADICIWAHVRHIEKNCSLPLITQPCPAIVLYCETYRHDLLKNLSPIQSPMACTAIYMKHYAGIEDRIAALSPCIAKSAEFADTQLAQYNVTFKKLQQYLEKNNVELPPEETGFDHDESGLGALFPIPGGLKENIVFHLGRKINISKAEGFDVYEKINKYAKTPPERLPEIFDVLSCAEGCNIGSAVACECNIFDIDAVMSKKRNAATDVNRQKYFESLYRIYDKKFDGSHFIRKYRAIEGGCPTVTDKDIDGAFELLGKTDYEKQHVDCGACGSETCYNMARKIALGVNIPINCIVKTMEDARREHEENLAAREHFAYMEHTREADERTRIMLDTTPLGAQFWDKNINVIDCNQETIRLFNAPGKKEYLENFYAYFPEYQPDGSLSKEKSVEIVKKAFDEGYHRREWMCQTLDGIPIPAEVTLVRVHYKGDHLVAAYTRDLREQKRMTQEIDAAVTKLEAANRAIKSAQLTMSAMFEANPHINILFNNNFEIIDCNPAAMRFMGFKTKEEMIAGFVERFAASLPTIQSTGRASFTIHERLGAAAKEGFIRFETDTILGGDLRILNIELKRIPYENSFAIVAYVFDITDIREREKELIRAHELNEFQLTKLNLAIQAAKIGFWDLEYTKHGPGALDNIFTWSDGFWQLLSFPDGTNFPNTLGSWHDRLHPEDKEKTLEAVRNHLNDKTGKTPYNMEYRMLKENGEYAYFHVVGAAIRDKDGNPVRITGSLMDITETKKMTEALNEAVNESRNTIAVMSNVLNNSDGMIYVSDKDTDKILFINDSLKRHFDITEDVIGQPCYKVFYTDVEEKCEWCPCRRLDKEPDNAVVWEERNTKTKRYYRNTDRYIDWHGGQKAHIQHRVDLTDIRQMSIQLEAALEQANVARNELMLQKTTLQTIIDSIPDLVFCKDINFKYTLLNTACIEYLNIDIGDIIGKNDYELNFPGTVAEKMVAADKKIFAGEQMVVDNDWIPSFEGESRYLETTKAPLLQDSSIVGIVGVARDITEKMRMEKTLEAALAQAEAASKAKSEFLSKMSHEIRTPMNAILGITEIQLRNESLLPDTKEALGKIYNAGDLLLGIINDILDLSKIEAGKFELTPNRYDVASLINDVVTLNMMRIGSKQIEFNLSLNENTPATLFGDELRIKQILNNILSNAIKYTAKGSVELSVSINAKDAKKGDDVVLTIDVKDTGVGMTEEQVSMLFDAYTRFNMEANRTTEGTGLGMSITQNLVRLMDGNIIVKSESGKGSVVTVQLPQKRIGSDVLGAELVENLQKFRTNGIKQIKMAQVVFEKMSDGRVLVVDDVESNLYVAKGLLAPYGLSVDTATSGYEAIDKISRGKAYDIIFMDHMMPKMDGIEATKILRDMGYTRPIVALTANVVSGQSDIFLKNGFDGFVPKPIDVRLLNAVLKKYVRDKLSPENPGNNWNNDAANQQDDGFLRDADATAQPSSDTQLIRFFLQDARKAVVSLETIHERKVYDAEDVRAYIVSVHGMKSALAYIGESELSAFAGKLEKAGRANDTTVMLAETSKFLDTVKELIEKLTPQREKSGETASDDYAFLREKLLLIKDACESYDKKTAKNALSELAQKAWQPAIKEKLDAMAENLLGGDFELVSSLADSIIEPPHGG